VTDILDAPARPPMPIDVNDGRFYDDPWDAYRWLRDHDPCHWDAANELWVTTREPRELFALLPGLTAETGVSVRELGSDGESLDAVFEYLVGDGA